MGFVTAAIWLLTSMPWRVVAKCLRPKRGILRRNHHSNAVVECKGDQREHDSCHEQSLWTCMRLPDTEDGKPEDADADRSQTDDARAKEDQHDEEEDDIIDGENLGGFH